MNKKTHQNDRLDFFRIIICALGVCLTFDFFSQTKSYSDLVFLKHDTIKGLYKPQTGKAFLFVPSKFASDEVQNGRQLDSVSGFYISKIVLVYSGFHKTENFSQSQLNLRRWEHMMKNYPSLFSSGLTRYQEVCQLGPKADTAARKLAHGFYVYYENRAGPAIREKEINEINKMLEQLGINPSDTVETDAPPSLPALSREAGEVPVTEKVPVGSGAAKKSKITAPMRAKDSRACRRPYYANGEAEISDFFRTNILLTSKQLKKRQRKKLVAAVHLRLEYNGNIRYADISSLDSKLITQITAALPAMDPWHPAVRNGITVKSEVNFTLRLGSDNKMELSGKVEVPRSLAKCGTTSDEELFDFSPAKSRERLIPKSFESTDGKLLRNVVERNPDMDSLLMVVDLTGSMGPYIAQVLDLMSELVVKNDPCVTCFSLFNDGDAKEDHDKKISKTGGIYILSDDISLDKLGKLISKAMRRGSGGDSPENNLEAVIEAEKKCQHYKDIVMVADNWATPRDAGLVVKLSRPVHWILCGVDGEINPDYLDLVRENKGVLHTSNSDVVNLHRMKENETISIDGIVYKLVKGRFRIWE